MRMAPLSVSSLSLSLWSSAFASAVFVLIGAAAPSPSLKHPRPPLLSLPLPRRSRWRTPPQTPRSDALHAAILTVSPPNVPRSTFQNTLSLSANMTRQEQSPCRALAAAFDALASGRWARSLSPHVGHWTDASCTCAHCLLKRACVPNWIGQMYVCVYTAYLSERVCPCVGSGRCMYVCTPPN